VHGIFQLAYLEETTTCLTLKKIDYRKQQKVKVMRTIKGVTDAIRLQIIQEYLEGATQASLSKKYKLKNSRSIVEWMRIFGIIDSRRPQTTMKKERITESEEVCRLKKELKETKLALYRANMRVDFNDTMIDVAEEMFNIPIRKKAGTKQ